MKADHFLQLLRQNSFDFFSGVPCSYFSNFCQALAAEKNVAHIQAVREDIALAIACGAFLAGKQPAVYMQNSGLGYSLEVFASLLLIYRIPLLVMVSQRGPQDPGWEEHLVMGQHTEAILQTFRLAYEWLNEKSVSKDVAAIQQRLVEERQPYVLLVGQGVLS